MYMYGIMGTLFWILVTVLALAWVFLPWIIISKMDQMIFELRSLAQLLAKLSQR